MDYQLKLFKDVRRNEISIETNAEHQHACLHQVGTMFLNTIEKEKAAVLDGKQPKYSRKERQYMANGLHMIHITMKELEKKLYKKHSQTKPEEEKSSPLEIVN